MTLKAIPIIALIVLGAGVLAPVSAEDRQPSDKPNIVLIHMDNFGYGELGS